MVYNLSNSNDVEEVVTKMRFWEIGKQYEGKLI